MKIQTFREVPQIQITSRTSVYVLLQHQYSYILQHIQVQLFYFKGINDMLEHGVKLKDEWMRI